MTAYDRLITQAAVEEEFAEEQKLESIRNKKLLENSRATEPDFEVKPFENYWDTFPV